MTFFQRAFSMIVLCCLIANSQAAETYFAFDSAPGAWVGRGYTDYSVSPDTGWTITARHSSSRVASFEIRRDAGADPGRDNYYWTLEFASPSDQLLTPGVYLNSARYPFQDANQPGLTLSGNHRGNNRNGGFFEILLAEYGAGGEVLKFAANFTQHGEESPNWTERGEIRFNYSVPEPSSVMLIALFCGPLLMRCPHRPLAFDGQFRIGTPPRLALSRNLILFSHAENLATGGRFYWTRIVFGYTGSESDWRGRFPKAV